MCLCSAFWVHRGSAFHAGARSHLSHKSCPSELRLFQEGVDARESSTGKDFVLPFYPE